MGSRIDPDKIKKDFPILKNKMNGKPLIYLDSAATSQKPKIVIDTITDYYENYNANIHRGIYKIAETATERYIESKRKLAGFIGAEKFEEIIYVRNTTEAINLVALTWGASNIKKGDRILISEMEHHSNIVPWQMLAKKKGAIIDYIKMDKNGEGLSDGSFLEQIEKEPKLLAITHVSNVLGSINDVKSMTKIAKKNGATVLLDGAQSVPHMPVNVNEIGCDFFALSGHKMLAPTGIGALYGKMDLLDSMEPLFGGGDMIKNVGFDSYTTNDLPWKFEAGTSNIEGGIALGAAVDYLEKIGMQKVREHEKELTVYALEKLNKIKGLKVFGYGKENIEKRGGVISFSLDKIHPHDVSAVFDSFGIAIRAGHHCAMPLVRGIFKVGALSRMSFYIYNNKRDVDVSIDAINSVKNIFKVK